MMKAECAVLVLLMVVLVFAAPAAAVSGTATYYTTYTPSACYGNQDKGVMIAAASDVLWGNGAACGRRYRVKCTGATNAGGFPCKDGSVVVTIVDYCPSGCQGTLDLSKQAFAKIASTDAGKIKIDYQQ